MQTVNIAPFLSIPIDAGLCNFGDVHKLDIDDFADMNEILMIRAENNRRAEVAAKAKRKK